MPAEDTFGRQYLSKLDAILDRHKHRHTNGTEDVPLQDRARERRLTSPLPFSAAHRLGTKQALYGTGVSSEGELSSSSASSLTSSEDELEQRGQPHALNVPSARVDPRRSDQVPTPVKRKETHGGTVRHHSDLDGSGQSRNPSQTAVLHSLHSINSQLGQLLNKVGTGSRSGEGISVSNGHTHPGGGGGGNMHSGYTPLSLEETLAMPSSSR